MINAVLAISANIIDVQLISSDMRAYVDIGKYWQEGLSVNAAYEDLIMKGMKIDRRTLSNAKDGTLSRSEYSTLIRLRDLVRELSGNKKLCIDDILIVKEDEDD
jgi:hypothetical protein